MTHLTTQQVTTYESLVGLAPEGALHFLHKRIGSKKNFEEFHSYSANSSTDFLMDPDVILLDLRSADSYSKHHIEGAINFPLSNCRTLREMCELISPRHVTWGPLFSNSHYYHLVLCDAFDIDAHDGEIPGMFPESLEQPITEETISETFFKLLLIKSVRPCFSEDYTRIGNFCRSVRVLKGGVSSFVVDHNKKCTYSPNTCHIAVNKSSCFVTRDQFCLWGSREQLADLAADGNSLRSELCVTLIIDLSKEHTPIYCSHDSGLPQNALIRNLHFASQIGNANASPPFLFYQRFGDILKEVSQMPSNERVYVCSESNQGLSLSASIAIIMQRSSGLTLCDALYDLSNDSCALEQSTSLDPWAFYALAIYDLDKLLATLEDIGSIKRTNIIKDTIAPKYWYFPVSYLISKGIVKYRSPGMNLRCVVS